MLPSKNSDKPFKIVAVSGKPPHGTLLVQTAPDKGRIIELEYEPSALPEWNLESLIRSGPWHDKFEPFDNETLAKIKHLIDTAEE
jgi:hypothetical protein